MSKFQDYVTSSAFRLDLSRAMCKALGDAYINHHGEVRTWNGRAYTYVLKCEDYIYLRGTRNLASLQAVARRGLVDWVKDETGSSFELHCTEEGVLTLRLVVIAGILDEKWAEVIELKRQWLTDTEEKRQELLATRKVKPAKQEVAI